MIHVRNLTKYYGDYAAVRDVSFDVRRGDVVGFLGPNGAGKTTTMRVLAGYLAATSGTATVAGLDVFWRSVEVRRRIGYLPENCPLYPELRVEEYLRFRAGIKGLSRAKRRQRIGYVVDRCWLTDVRRQLIGTLSKGYRQRVGLADALLADPPVLILDEPTAGLDPAQIRETRGLVRELGSQHTILLSTHILPEVEMTCDHAIIIARGTVVAAGALDELAGQAGERVMIEAVTLGAIDPAPLGRMGGVTGIESDRVGNETHLRVFAEDAEDLAPRLCRLAAERNWQLLSLRPRRQTLEELFVRLTGAEK